MRAYNEKERFACFVGLRRIVELDPPSVQFSAQSTLTTPEDLRDDPEHAKLVRVLALFYLPPPLSVREATQERSTSWNPIACSPSCIPLQDRALVSQTSSSSFFCMSSRVTHLPP